MATNPAEDDFQISRSKRLIFILTKTYIVCIFDNTLLHCRSIVKQIFDNLNRKVRTTDIGLIKVRLIYILGIFCYNII